MHNSYCSESAIEIFTYFVQASHITDGTKFRILGVIETVTV